MYNSPVVLYNILSMLFNISIFPYSLIDNRFLIPPIFLYLYFSLKILSSLQLQTYPLLVFVHVISFPYKYLLPPPSYNITDHYRLNNIITPFVSYNFLNYILFISTYILRWVLLILIFIVIFRCCRFVLLFKLLHFIFCHIYLFLFLSVTCPRCSS